MSRMCMSRKVNQRVVIRVPGLARPIVVCVYHVDRNKLKFLVEADQAVEINREELDREKHPEDSAS